MVHFFGANVQLYVLKNVGFIWKYAINHLQVQLKNISIVHNQHFNNDYLIDLPFDVFEDGNAKKFTPMGLCKMLKAKWQ